MYAIRSYYDYTAGDAVLFLQRLGSFERPVHHESQRNNGAILALAQLV